MQLQPKRPPGRADRKAAAYATEILRLRAEGYTYEAIREALVDVGIELSESALRREVRRRHQRGVRAEPDVRPPSQAPDVLALPVPQPVATGPPPSTSATACRPADSERLAVPATT